MTHHQVWHKEKYRLEHIQDMLSDASRLYDIRSAYNSVLSSFFLGWFRFLRRFTTDVFLFAAPPLRIVSHRFLAAKEKKNAHSIARIWSASYFTISLGVKWREALKLYNLTRTARRSSFDRFSSLLPICLKINIYMRYAQTHCGRIALKELQLSCRVMGLYSHVFRHLITKHNGRWCCLARFLRAIQILCKIKEI